MTEQYVYGWYDYSDGSYIVFRYPASKSDSLKIDGKKVTVEVKNGGGWSRRRGVVVWGGGNYTVIPA
jgi:hypothetical protein